MTLEREVRVATVTVSDTRSLADDESGARLRERIEASGATVTLHRIVRDEPTALRALVEQICDDDLADAIVTTGGTGIAARDTTIEALEALFEKRLDGFGEAFRRLSWEEIGPRSVLSRAAAGTVHGRLVVALPGSPRAVVLGVDRVLAPILGHAVGLLRGERPSH
jgi:molybdenum cofactor biosynthesis protein B